MPSVWTVTTFGRDLGDGYTLTLRDLTTVDPVLALVHANTDRLRAAEPWAWDPQTRAAIALHTERLLGQFAMDRALPCVIRADDRIVGVASLTFDPYLGQASLGYWVDAGQEGRGVVRRAATVLIGVARARGSARMEIRTAVDNARSRGSPSGSASRTRARCAARCPSGPSVSTSRCTACCSDARRRRAGRPTPVAGIVGAWPCSDDATPTCAIDPSARSN